MNAGRELDALVARKVMGLGSVFTPIGLVYTKLGQAHQGVPNYSTNIAAAYAMETKIDELGLRDEYVWALQQRIEAIASIDEWWGLVHATPMQRCLAALKAIGVNIEETNLVP